MAKGNHHPWTTPLVAILRAIRAGDEELAYELFDEWVEEQREKAS